MALPKSFSSLSSRLRRWPSLLWRLEASARGARFLGRVDIVGRPIIRVVKGGKLEIGDGVSIFSSPASNPLGLSQACTIRVMAPGAAITLARNVGLSGVSLCAASGVEIGEGTILGASVMVMDTDFHMPKGTWEWQSSLAQGGSPVKIGRGAFIGSRAIILKGVEIGDRAIVGAGAVVTKNVPAHHFAVGNPAKILPPKHAPPASPT